MLIEVEDGAHDFTHDLIRDTVVASLGAARRAVIHRRIATVLLALPDVRQQVAELAWHLADAHEPAQSLPYALQAGEQAEAAYAHAEAEHHFRMALCLAHRVGDKFSATAAMHKLGAVLAIVGRYDDALDYLLHGVSGYKRRGELQAQAILAARIGTLHARRATAAQGVEYVREQLQALSAAGLPPAGQAALYLAVAHLYKALNEYPAMLEAAERTCEMGAKGAEAAVVAGAQMRRGSALLMLGRDSEGQRVLEDALPLLERAGEMEILCHALNNLAVECETRRLCAGKRLSHTSSRDRGALRRPGIAGLSALTPRDQRLRDGQLD